MDYLISTIINMVKTTPNDTDLGKKIRSIIQPLISEQRPTNEGKQILKD